MRLLSSAILLALVVGVAHAQEGLWRGPAFGVAYAAAGWRLAPSEPDVVFAVSRGEVRCAFFAHPDADLAAGGAPIRSQADANAAVARRTLGRDGYTFHQTQDFAFSENAIENEGRSYRSFKFGVWDGTRATIYDLQCAAASEALLATDALMPLVQAIRLN